ncbi:hypothetical protein IEQ34_020664 [Dendrobium chrysotoxum]|uniref:Uncharacterized protein n=1 Tax=Dendrobium chrysotoxum TaxID=161865 RepID=A0AAV7G3E5_DENCH|nr:hypothetical protein IEQ34_020664 [Dendrobium chrysotoxum]
MAKMSKILVFLLKILKHLRSIYLLSLSNFYHLMFIIYDKGDFHVHKDFLPKDLNNLFNPHYLKFP